ncbi:MAG: acyl-CoA dehydrogenase [Acidimicrobiia bacterium]|nr:acyl-CoA dehydrogenase [Acidimicrobiia bacterium]
MSEYTAPIADMEFVLRHVSDLERVSKLNGFQHADPDTAIGVLGEAGRFFTEVIAPTNWEGDQVGSVLNDDGSVTTPDGFKEAYRKFVDAGWPGVHLPEMAGGGGFPYAVGIALQEMFTSANMAFSLAPLLTQGAIDALIEHGSEEQQATYLEKLATGEWTGTMCLTEPHAGSDLGTISTKAVKQDDGTYRITGQKIYITWGEHDLTENIIHLVLAKTPDAAPGTRGISMFIVPKYIPDAAGDPGERNDVRVVSIEHKMGINASPTCVLAFGDEGGAIGYLVGEEQRGMKYMFTMMNSARIGVAVEGLAIGEMAYQKAARYASERIQSKPLGGDAPAAIINHPDVRRMLLTMRANNEAMRAALYDTAARIDIESHGDTEDDRVRASERVALMIPILKAWCTDLGVEMASLGVQVHGGMGYVEETGAAQFLRDARIAPIYEGTNGIQALDLVTRKVPLRDGQVVKEYLTEMTATAAELRSIDGFERSADELDTALESLSEASTHVGAKMASGEYADAVAGATPFTRMWGTVVGGAFLARSAIAASQLASGDEHRAKLTVARFYCEQILPTAGGLLGSVLATADPLFELSDEELTV